MSDLTDDLTPVSPQPWYAPGLCFECTQCGNCCSGPSGYVWFTPEEGESMAESLGMSTFDFLQQYARRVWGRWSLREVRYEDRYECVFLIDLEGGKKGCRLYKSRPAQCRSWPFWPQNLKSMEEWELSRRDCKGMKPVGHEGTGFVSVDEIRVILDNNPRTLK